MSLNFVIPISLNKINFIIIILSFIRQFLSEPRALIPLDVIYKELIYPDLGEIS